MSNLCPKLAFFLETLNILIDRFLLCTKGIRVPLSLSYLTRNPHMAVYLKNFVLIAMQLKSKDGKKPIGRISKQWSGLLKEVFTDTDNFGIQFPLDMDVKMKAVLMGACFLIVRSYSLNYTQFTCCCGPSRWIYSPSFVVSLQDFMFFEKVGEANQRSTVFS